jgi:hypothetical protein
VTLSSASTSMLYAATLKASALQHAPRRFLLSAIPAALRPGWTRSWPDAPPC